jgi:hypothetical protein
MAGIPKDVWYSAGLSFRCTQCGDCCSGAEGYVWVNQAEIDAMAARTGMDPAAFEAAFVKRVGVRRSLKERLGGDCVLLPRGHRRAGRQDQNLTRLGRVPRVHEPRAMDCARGCPCRRAGVAGRAQPRWWSEGSTE